MRKIVKRITAVCVSLVMAATSMIGINTSADMINFNNRMTSYNMSISPYALNKKTLNVSLCSQENTNWCWVASAQMIMKYYGVNKTQDEIYMAAKGTTTVENTSGSATDIMTALNTLVSGESFTKVTTGKYSSIQNKISSGRPVIIIGKKGGNSHAIVCKGFDKTNGYVLNILDPSNSSGGISTMTCSSDSNSTYTLTNDNGRTFTFVAETIIY